MEQSCLTGSVYKCSETNFLFFNSSDAYSNTLIFAIACRSVNQPHFICSLPSHPQVNYVPKGDGGRNWNWIEAFNSQLQACIDWYLPWKANVYHLSFTKLLQKIKVLMMRKRTNLACYSLPCCISLENQWLGVFRNEKSMETGDLCQVKKLQYFVCTSTISPA